MSLNIPVRVTAPTTQSCPALVATVLRTPRHGSEHVHRDAQQHENLTNKLWIQKPTWRHDCIHTMFQNRQRGHKKRSGGARHFWGADNFPFLSLGSGNSAPPVQHFCHFYLVHFCLNTLHSLN